MSFAGVFQIDIPSSFSPPSRPVSLLPTPAQPQHTLRPTFRVPYFGAPAHHSSPPSSPSPPSPNGLPLTALPVSDARTRRWVNAHALVSAPLPPTYTHSHPEQKSIFSDDSDVESISSTASTFSLDDDQDDEIHPPSVSSSDSDDDDNDNGSSAIFMTRNHSHFRLRLRSSNPSTTSLSTPPSLSRGRSAARRLTQTTGLRPFTPPSVAPVVLDHSRARGLSSGAASNPPHHPRSSPSLTSLIAPSLTTDDSDESTPSVSESIPIPSALSRGRCRPSRFPPPDDDSEDEHWWMPSPPDAARKERERARTTGRGAFWDGWMRTANYA